MNRQSRFDAGYRKLGAGALGWPRGMVWGGRWEGGSRWGTRVHPWQMHVDVWQNQYNIVKFKKKKKASILWHSAFFMVQLSHPCTTTEKSIASSCQPQASSILHRTWTGDSFLIWYYTCFNASLPNHPLPPLPQSPKDCSIHLCLFCCLTYRVVITIFLNSI